jgi:signal transduction histidine kinase
VILESMGPEGFEILNAPQPICMVLGDPADIYRVVFNLVQNAVTAARRGAPMTFVNIDVACQGPVVSMRISDDGPGLPKAVRARLFRKTGSTTGSSGLGIAIARELAERNGATLRLDETAKGTSYVLELVKLHATTGARMGAFG